MNRKVWYLIAACSLILLVVYVQQQTRGAQGSEKQVEFNSAINAHARQQPTPMPPILLPPHAIMPTAAATTVAGTPPALPTGTPPAVSVGKGSGADPYGQPPTITAEETQLTQQLFALINSDRAVRGLYPYDWNNTLAGGARLHSWNMYHCGFSHTCPDGTPQCTRIANEGFANSADCGENIAYAGPYPTPYQGAKNIQEGMVNEPPTGWHRIHLLSTSLHMVGVGVYVDPSGFIWFTEDLVG